MKPPPPTDKLPSSESASPGKVRLRAGGIPGNLHPVAFRPAAPVAIAPAKTTAIRAGWLLLLIGFALACIPVLGFVSWLIGYPLCFAALILGCLGAANGRAVAGVVLILTSITAAPVAFFIAPFISTMAVSAASKPKPAAPAEVELPGEGWKPRDYVPKER